MAFIINAPMQFFERHLFGSQKMKDKKWARKLARPISLLTSLLLVVVIILVVIFIVAPELGKTFVSLGKTISDFIPELQDWLEEMFNGNQAVSYTHLDDGN